MSFRFTLFLILVGFGLGLLVASFQRAPGYMDADYYFAGGQRLAGGHGFSEEILWNYLDDPAGLPHPSHSYWMPLVSILSALGMALAGSVSFSSAQLPFISLMALVPVITGALAWRIHHQPRAVWLAAGLALFPAFYLPFLPTTDGFGLTMILGGLFFLLIEPEGPTPATQSQPRWQILLSSLALGLLAGLLYLTRADGLLWLLLALLVVLSNLQKTWSERWFSRRILIHAGLCLLGFLLVSGPWMARNLAVFGTPFSPGAGSALWITKYDELFIYPASLLTLSRWLSAGWASILEARLWSAGQNLQSALAVQGLIFLAPLILAGMWRLRRDRRVQIAGLAWTALFVLMTFVFPFQGARGGFFHSGAALQPFFWAITPAGFEAFLSWGVRRRGWRMDQARRFFSAGLVIFALLLSFMVTYNRFKTSEAGSNAWNLPFQRYLQLEQELRRLGFTDQEVVLVNNSPGYYIASQRPALSIPYGELPTVCAVASRYQAALLLLEIDQIPGGSSLYSDPSDQLCLHYLDTFSGVRIFEFRAP